MATPFNPDIPPDVTSKLILTPRVLKVAFGDGYEQRVIDGLNALVATANLVWVNLSTDEASSIQAFLAGSMGFAPFTFTFPGDIARNWVTDGPLTITPLNQLTVNLSQNIRQVFDIGT